MRWLSAQSNERQFAQRKTLHLLTQEKFFDMESFSFFIANFANEFQTKNFNNI